MPSRAQAAYSLNALFSLGYFQARPLWGATLRRMRAMHPAAEGFPATPVRIGKVFMNQRVAESASFGCTAARGGARCLPKNALSALLVAIGIGASACAGPGWPGSEGGVVIETAPAPSEEERYCAWYGDPGPDGVLYFGQAAFWSSMAAAGGDPAGDLEHEGPQLVGRFDLERERLLPPLRVDDPAGPPKRSGVWDIHVTEGSRDDERRVFFTTFYETAGWVDPRTGEVGSLDFGGGLNEFAPGPEGTVLVTRYGSGSDDGGDGEIVAFDPGGAGASPEFAWSWPLFDPAGYRVAPKTPAWDPLEETLWLTTDLLPPEGSTGTKHRHDAIRIDSSGAPRLFPDPPELHFVAAGPDGALYRAYLEGRKLSLHVSVGESLPREILLDEAFATGVDFVQDIKIAADGRVVLTRWSGRVDVLHPDGRIGSVQLPRPDPAGIYYTGVVYGDRLCVTYCADVSVVCVDAP